MVIGAYRPISTGRVHVVLRATSVVPIRTGCGDPIGRALDDLALVSIDAVAGDDRCKRRGCREQWSA